MILIDTSAWVEYFRATGSIAAVEVRRLLSEEAARIAMCEPIAMEILPSLNVDDAIDFRAAAGIYRAARRAGETVRSINDCLIAALAIRHGARIVHRDADFDVIARITNLQAASFR